MARTKVFVSYSRHDEALVKPLAGLLGVAAEDAVFLDVASIEPGTRWKDTIDGALRESSVFVLCWCCEAQKSPFIGHEIALALAGGRKRLVPVLFCSTPLPPSLSEYQWIDLRTQIRHSCSHGEATATSAFAVPAGAAPAPTAMPASAMRKSSGGNKAVLGAIAAALVVAFVGFSLLTKKSSTPNISESRGETPAPMASVESPRPQNTIRTRKKSASEGKTAENKSAGEVEPAPIPASGESESADHTGVILGAIVAALALLLCMGLMIRRARKKKVDQITAAASAYFHGLKTGPSTPRTL